LLQKQKARAISKTVVAADRTHEMPIVAKSIPPTTQAHTTLYIAPEWVDPQQGEQIEHLM